MVSSVRGIKGAPAPEGDPEGDPEGIGSGGKMMTSIVCQCGRPITMDEVIEVGKPDGARENVSIFIGYYCFGCKEIGQQMVNKQQWNACYLAQYLEI